MKVGDRIRTVRGYAGDLEAEPLFALVTRICGDHLFFRYVPPSEGKSKRIKCDNCHKGHNADGWDHISSWKVDWSVERALETIEHGV